MILDNNKKIKVLLLAPQKATGGIASWTRRLLKISKQDRIEYKIIDTSKLFDPLGKKLGPFGALLGMRDAVIRFFKILNSLYHYRPDLVYITSSPSIGLFIRDVPLMFMLHVMGIKCISHLRGGKLEGFWGKNVLRRWITLRAFRTCKAVFVITRDVEEYARKHIDPNIIYYIPNMIEDSKVHAVTERHIKSTTEDLPFNLIHVAWQAPEKGSMDLIEALGQVKSNIRCKLVGEIAPQHKDTLSQLIQKWNLNDKVTTTGILKGEDLADIYHEADIFVFPTHFEGFPNVILEAMAYGLPIISNDVGNIREMIGYDTDASAGLLLEQISPVNPVEIAQKIDYLIQNNVLRQQMSINGRNRVKENYLASKVVPNLEALLVQLAKENPTPQSISHIFEQRYF